ncbi:MAG: proteinase inhibitor I4 serpin [Myxococcus sp.]|nr:proteinase inhibitor I4 serpin [Myxococcus sp.]
MLSHSTWWLLAALTLAGCDGRCSRAPEPGPCRAAVPKAYFDASTRRCAVFTWGGCDGVVPFDTLEECRQICGG